MTSEGSHSLAKTGDFQSNDDSYLCSWEEEERLKARDRSDILLPFR